MVFIHGQGLAGLPSCGAYTFNDCKAFWATDISDSTLACHVGFDITCTCD